MRIGSSVHNVKDRNSARDDCVGDQRAMAAPGNCLGAHDSGRLEIAHRQKVIERFLKLARLHVVSVSAEAGVSPKSVPRVASSATAATERGKMRVPVAGVDEYALEIGAGEVRVSR